MKTITTTFIAIIFTLNVCLGNEKKDTNIREIVKIEHGIKDGKTGKAAVYVYFKDKTDVNFNPKKDRVLVFVDSLREFKKTFHYKIFLKK